VAKTQWQKGINKVLIKAKSNKNVEKRFFQEIIKKF